jgi:hypothetical protein
VRVVVQQRAAVDVPATGHERAVGEPLDMVGERVGARARLTAV